MRAPKFWYQPPQRQAAWQATLLQPIAALYQLGYQLRRRLARPLRLPVPVVCVGNVTLGGSGKTPTVLALAQLLQAAGARPAIISRGYGGQQRGPLRVNPQTHTAAEVGDEALLLAQAAPTWIGRNKAATALAACTAGDFSPTHLLLDDGLQNPTLIYDYTLLVIDSTIALGNGALFPAGPLREPLTAALSRTHAIIVIGGVLPPPIAHAAAASAKPIYATAITTAFAASVAKASYLAFAGIGHPEKFFASARTHGLTLQACVAFPDHHPYTLAELQQLAAQASEAKAQLLTTRKDWVRLPAAWQAQVQVLDASLTFANPAPLVATLLALRPGTTA